MNYNNQDDYSKKATGPIPIHLYLTQPREYTFEYNECANTLQFRPDSSICTDTIEINSSSISGRHYPCKLYVQMILCDLTKIEFKLDPSTIQKILTNIFLLMYKKPCIFKPYPPNIISGRYDHYDLIYKYPFSDIINQDIVKELNVNK